MMLEPRTQRGQTLAEFAIAFPVFLLLLFGLIDIGRAAYAYSSITNAAREGARLAIVNQSTTSVQLRAANQATAIDVTTTIQFHQPRPNGDATENDTCSALGIGCIAVVGVDTTWSALTPVIGSLLGPIAMHAESQVPVEFVCPNPSITGFADESNCLRRP